MKCRVLSRVSKSHVVLYKYNEGEIPSNPCFFRSLTGKTRKEFCEEDWSWRRLSHSEG